MIEVSGEEYLRISRNIANLSREMRSVSNRLDDMDTYLQRGKYDPYQSANNDKFAYFSACLRNARKALEERDTRIRALVQCGIEADKIETALHNEISERDATIRGMDNRILSLLAEIREKNVTIARLLGSEPPTNPS
jgi:uncharacterized coiled-coil DUF342 family protein